MLLSSRVKAVGESITLKLNEKAVKLAETGVQVYNLTAGQLPFKPPTSFVESIQAQLNFLKSFQYAPVQGVPELREKFIRSIEKERDVVLPRDEYDCVVNNGAKHTVYNVLGTLIDPSDEVILLAPYWVSYPEMVRFWGGEPIVVKSSVHNGYTPEIDDIKKAISFNTKVIILNCPNNPTGVHYSKEWMQQFAELMQEHKEIVVISDEIYYELTYFDPKPVYFYQIDPSLIERTIIVDGISKCLASTGLRIGFAVGPKNMIKSLSKLQAQTTSGASSLIQRALIDFDFNELAVYLKPIHEHLRGNARILRERFRENNLTTAWYQTTSAFYFTLDFSSTDVVAKLREEAQKQDEKLPDDQDFASEICEELLEQHGLAMVPSSDFGVPNAARMSLVLEEGPFRESVDRLIQYLTNR